MNIETAINNAITQTNKTAARAIAKVTAQATRYSTQRELDDAYQAVIDTHTRTIQSLHAALAHSKLTGVA